MSTPSPFHAAARRLATVGAVTLLAAATPLAVAPSAGAAGAAPQVLRCTRLSGSAQKRCRAQNAANRALFTQLKNTRLVGTRGDDEAVDWLFCANGRYELRTGSGSVGVSRGSRWTVEDARARQGNRWLEGVVSAPGGLEVGVLRRGSQWQVAVASLGRMLYPGDVQKTPAGAACG
ncbi:hypothetical protein [Conexibacter woesei]|uniref:Secreted protein n=1 Tax=Conexibacter woesei (strain DSM 14684 / CCUG 47730 / CIP 108061 / JCM 11494 / NBRC 100937 / ID131577) TaxID=469383 RepID=D3FF82_CONWI|nr:hypothetical protein [Conexibacter woesei]ADB51799.1 hypothetical protein Cwoe_3381 [Conexibacter woesei DSM 14684]